MIAIIDYGVGNVGSINNMFNYIGIPSLVTNDPSVIGNAAKLILPGVGSFDQGMTLLNESGLRDLLDDKVLSQQIPILGICLGMQMMTKGSEEGTLSGLNWIEGECLKFNFAEGDKSLRIPHMGWNDVIPKNVENFSFKTINNELQFYFAHSYHLVCNEDIITATASYGYEFPVAFKKNNILGVQFHPEKSHKFGMNFLKAFAQ